MQSESGKRKLMELEQMKADVAQQKLELAEKEKAVERLEKRQKMMEQAAKLREQVKELERQTAELDQQATAKTTVSTNTERCIAGSASLQPTTVSKSVVAPVAAKSVALPNAVHDAAMQDAAIEDIVLGAAKDVINSSKQSAAPVSASVAASGSKSVSKTSCRGWPELVQTLQRTALPPRNYDDGNHALLGGTFFEIDCQFTPNDPECMGERCHHPAHNREIYDPEKNPTGNVMRFDDDYQMQRRPTPTVTDKRRRELQKTAQEEHASLAKKKQREQKSKQSADNGGAAVSAASGASARKPTFSQLRGGRGGKRVGAPRKCPVNNATKPKKSKKEFVSHAVQKAAQIASHVQKFQHLNAEDAKKEINKVKEEAICRVCPGHKLMQLVPHGPDGTDFAWICEVCEVQSHNCNRSHILTAFAQLEYKIF